MHLIGLELVEGSRGDGRLRRYPYFVGWLQADLHDYNVLTRNWLPWTVDCKLWNEIYLTSCI